jgi:hypothetical protein
MLMTGSNARGTCERENRRRAALALSLSDVRYRRPKANPKRGASDYLLVSLAVAMLVTSFTLGLTAWDAQTVWSFASRYLTRSQPPALRTAGVLLVAANQAYGSEFRAIVEPRGYAVNWVKTADQGIRRVEQHPQEIGIVIIDGALPGSSAAARRISSAWPEKRVILLESPRRPGTLAQSLIDYL